MFSSVSVRLSVCLLTGLSETIDQIFTKFCETVGTNPRTSRLAFDGSPDL